MLRPQSQVATPATDTLHTRASRPRPLKRQRRAALHEIIRPGDIGLGQLFDLSRDALIVGDLETALIALWNPAAERLFGWPSAEAIGQPIDHLVPPEVLRLHRISVDLDRKSGQLHPIEAVKPFEVGARTMRGEELRVELSLAALDSPPRPGRYVLVAARDVTERQRSVQQSAELADADAFRQQAEMSMRRVAHLVQEGVDDATRELRRLRGSAQRLSQATNSPPTADRLHLRARVVDLRAERLQRAMEMLGTTAAIESNTLELQLERVNLVPLMQELVARTRARGIPHKLNLAVPQGLTALVDPRRIEQIVHILLERTIAGCPRGCWIDVDLTRPLVGLARIEIRDFGRAVPEHVRLRLLDIGGADQSLRLVKSIVELHGGSFGFEFPPDGGVLAVVTLPTQRGRVLATAS